MLFSHTYAKGNFLLQMNGDMKDEEFVKYKDVMDNFTIFYYLFSLYSPSFYLLPPLKQVITLA
ncbi:hypothetical protein CN491_01265 [Bacillus cereus]|uniref:Uncharacterized protein n=1 Tax=Bacillus cereus TaxID=1396 RepID=A0A2C1F3Q2_BACCE|nr:hypothetical protein CN491_01265 [Bacillus cereus]PGT19566.1 hypothetical protein COC96_05990 [Bacillus cereus]